MNHPYQVLGTSIPQLLARHRLVEQLERHLLKPSPDHVQLVGPTLFGKSVLLNGLAARIETTDNHFHATAYDDLRHSPPADDSTFRKRFAEVVKKALTAANLDVADYIELDEDGIHELLDLAFQELEQQDKRLLVVLDGFDHVLAGTGITRHLWDQLRSLAQKSSLRLVTGSRQPLRELCKTEESRTSDFWEIFYDTPLAVGPFADDDWDDLLAPLTGNGVTVDSAGKKELVNWSGGVPVLAVALLERLATAIQNGQTISKAEVDTIAEDMVVSPPAHLEQLWDDCGFELRGDVASLAEMESEGILLSEFSTQRQRAITARGYGVVSSNRMRSGCRLMTRYAGQQGPAIADVKRLFGKEADYGANIGGLLELRVAHLETRGADSQLLTYLKHSIRDIGVAPEISLVTTRSLVQRAIQLIWDAELPGTNTLPEEWTNEWKYGGANPRWLDDRRRMPSGDGQQMHALDLLTGKKVGQSFIQRKARFLTKSTFLLLDSLQSMGDFGQHLKDYPECPPTTGLAVAMIISAIEFVDALTRDLNMETPP